MGFGNYSHEAYAAITEARATLPRQEVFKQTSCHPLMNPFGVALRESRDSPSHPDSLGIVFALDVTGSMGDIPELLARKELPTFMRALLDRGVAAPQVLIAAVGDAVSDQAPLQVGQFESAAGEMDQWLTWSYLEGGGGGTNHESYELALYFLARHTAMDCFEKRRKRGYLFMTGDELPYPLLAREQVSRLVGDAVTEDLLAAQVVAEVRRTFHPFFLIPDLRRRAGCERGWRELLGDHVICMESAADTCHVAAGLVVLGEGIVPDLEAVAKQLRDAGLSRDRLGAILRALTPFAASLGRDGTPAPETAAVGLPSGDGPSGHRRSPAR